MQPYKTTRRSPLTARYLVKGALVVVSSILFFLIISAVFKMIRTPSLHKPLLSEQLSSKKALIAKIDMLQQSIGESMIANQEAEMLRRENDALKTELGRTVTHGAGVLARVLTLPNRSFYDTIIVDAGRYEGITEGDMAYAFDSILLGTVTDVREHQATVQLFSAPGRQTAGTAEGTDVAITLIGRGAGEYEVRMPRDVQFVIGELISYQSVGVAILAKIEHIATDPRDPFQRLLAKAPVNLAALKFVMVR